MNKKTLTTIAALAGLTTVTLHIINKVQFKLSTKEELLLNSKNQYYEWRFGKIKYTKKGKGAPLLLIHDLTAGSSSYEFHEIIDQLSETREVYAMDLLGYGLSDKPYITYTNYLYVQSIIDFIKNVIGKKTDIIATGDSAAIAVMAAHNDGEVIGKLCLINPQSLSKLNQIPGKRKKLLKFLIDTPILGTFVYNMLTNKEAFYKTFETEYFYDANLISEQDIIAYVEAAHLLDGSARYSYASHISRFMNANIIHALKQINHSIYILNGENKEEADEISNSYVYYNPAVEVFTVENTKQLPHLENAEAVLNLLSLV